MNSQSPSSSLSASLLRIKGVKKSYLMGKRSLDVLQGIDLEIESGAFIALRGASGAGKSTLLHLIGGLDSPDAGDIFFEDQNLSGLSAKDLARIRNRKIGFVFQSYHLFPELDALENVCLPARMQRTPVKESISRASELLEIVGLKDRMYHRPVELSGGEQQRVAIARALVNHPILLLADEPTGNLDSHKGEEIIELLCRIWKEKQTTLVIATHDTKVARRACSVLELVDGKLADSDFNSNT